MRVLVACEFSGIVRDAFRKKGHNAWSCDLLETEGDPTYHIKGDVKNMLKREWDLMIAHPPCTHLASSGARWFKNKEEEQKDAIEFFMSLIQAEIFMICVENPIGIMSTKYRKPDQIIQPWMFGDPHTKSTCLWLQNLPKLEPTDVVHKGERHITKSGKSLPEWYNLPPSPDRAKIRSRTFQGIADAMAEQWG